MWGLEWAKEPADAHADPAGEPAQGWAEYNRQNRLGAADFAQKFPVGHLVLLRVCQEPLLTDVMGWLLHLASDKWDLLNAAKALSGQPVKMRLLEVARDPDFGRFFAGVRSRLFDRHHWQAVPSLCRSTAMGTLAYKLLSRISGYTL